MALGGGQASVRKRSGRASRSSAKSSSGKGASPTGPHPSAATWIAGRYRLDKLLGKGGAAAVYQVTDRVDGRALALKRLTLATDPESDARRRLSFRREFHTLAGLRHPHIIEVYDYGVDRQPFYTMELLDGDDIRSATGLPVAEICRLLREVASALAFLHARRLVHRDLSTNNVRFTADGGAKLFDFGLLAANGVIGSPGGTPPCMAPEGLRGLPVDHRADLFGLGAIGYRLLTKQHAFPARGLDELEKTWRRGLVPPSRLNDAVPPALDELIVSLLSTDPLGRPSCAAEVIDRLGGIAKLDPLPAAETARGYLASAALIGRRRELDGLKRAIGGLDFERGAAVLLRGSRGVGRSRLLREAAVQAQLAGAITLSCDGAAGERGPYQVVRQIVRALVAAAPDQALATLPPARTALLCRVIPELRQILELQGQPSEEGHWPQTQKRASVQRELAAWILAVAREQPLALFVDNLEHTDEPSATVLATLAHHARSQQPLLLVAALRSGDVVCAPDAVSAFVGESAAIQLEGLDRAAVGELVSAFFGELEGGKDLARWIHETTAGNPSECCELVRHLVERDVLRYAEGAWTVGEELASEGLPQAQADALAARLDVLDPQARALLDVLAVHGGEVDLSLCAALDASADGRSDREGREGRLFAALDELERSGLLVVSGSGGKAAGYGSDGEAAGSGERLRFRREVAREAVLARLCAERRAALNRRVGCTLARLHGSGTVNEQKIGWHLYQGGDELAGAEHLERAGRALYDVEAYADAIAPLEAALGVLERARASRMRCLELREMLVNAGMLSNRAIALRYGDATVDELRRYSGMLLAARLRFLGRIPAMLIALFVRWLIWLFRGGRCIPSPGRAVLVGYHTMVVLASVKAVSLDFDGVAEMLDKMRPVGLLARSRRPYMGYLYVGALLDGIRGRIDAIREKAELFYRIDREDKLSPVGNAELERGAMDMLMAMVATARLEADCLERYEQLEETGLSLLVAAAQMCRGLYYRLRGEEQRARQLERETELLYLQMGTSCLPDVQRTWVSVLAYGDCRDVAGLRRCIDKLGRLVDKGYHLEAYLRLAASFHARERGELEAAQQILEQLAVDGRNTVLRIAATCGLSTVLLARGDATAALVRAREASRLALRVGGVLAQFRSICCEALAEAAVGDLEGAARRLDRGLQDVPPIPLGHGCLHEARARVALAAGDQSAYRQHLKGMEYWFRPTQNPALVARCEHLTALGAASRRAPAVEQAPCETNDATEAWTPDELAMSELEMLDAEDVQTSADSGPVVRRAESPSCDTVEAVHLLDRVKQAPLISAA